MHILNIISTVMLQLPRVITEHSSVTGSADIDCVEQQCGSYQIEYCSSDHPPSLPCDSVGAALPSSGVVWCGCRCGKAPCWRRFGDAMSAREMPTHRSSAAVSHASHLQLLISYRSIRYINLTVAARSSMHLPCYMTCV